jgi:hypothetical protein
MHDLVSECSCGHGIADIITILQEHVQTMSAGVLGCCQQTHRDIPTFLPLDLDHSSLLDW